jgi:hypothetical protein
MFSNLFLYPDYFMTIQKNNFVQLACKFTSCFRWKNSWGMRNDRFILHFPQIIID